MSLAKDEIRRFTDRLQITGGYHRELLLAVHLKKHQSALETMLAEQFVFNIVVYWEVFINDLLLSYLVMSPGQFSRNLKDRIQQSIKDRFGTAANRMMVFHNPSRLSIQQAAALADPKDFNISVTSADNLTTRANEILAAKYARLFTLDPDDRQFVDFLIAIRNYLAHRSPASRTVLKQSVAQLAGTNIDLNGQLMNVGTYLKTRNVNGDTNSLTIARRLTEVASKFA